MIVIDSSYALACTMPDEARPESMREVLAQPLQAPFLWPLELASAVLGAVRRRRIDQQQAFVLCSLLLNLDIAIAAAPHQDPLRYLDFATSHRLTPCDGLYLELALGRRMPLATRDRELIAAAARMGITVHS